MKSIKILVRTLLVAWGIVLIFQSSLLSQGDPIPVRKSAFDNDPPKLDQVIHHKGDFGAGFGLDYGGLLGVQAGYSPVKHLLIFASVGYHMINVGYQIGVKGLILANTTRNTVRPFVKVMYGNNSVIYVAGLDEYNKTYHGFTPGGGLQFRFGKAKKHGFDVDLNFPIHTQQFKDDYERLKHDPRVDLQNEVLPVAFSVGYHHEF